MNCLHKTAIAAGITTSNSRQRNEQLYPLVVAGDEDARREMIEGNMALVTLRVNTFIRFFPQAEYLRDDLMAEGMLALVKAVRNMKDRTGSEGCNPQGFILKSISNHIGDLLDSESNMQVSAGTVRSKRVSLVETQECSECGGELDNGWHCKDCFHDNRPDKFPRQIPMSGSMPDVAFDETRVRDLRDEIWSVAESDDERNILRMREEGYGWEEISKTLGLPLSTAYMMIRDLYERFLAVSGMTGEA